MIVAFHGDNHLLVFKDVFTFVFHDTKVIMRVDSLSIPYDLFLNIFDLHLSIVLTFSIAAYPVWYWHIR